MDDVRRGHRLQIQLLLSRYKLLQALTISVMGDSLKVNVVLIWPKIMTKIITRSESLMLWSWLVYKRIHPETDDIHKPKHVLEDP